MDSPCISGSGPTMTMHLHSMLPSSLSNRRSHFVSPPFVPIPNRPAIVACERLRLAVVGDALSKSLQAEETHACVDQSHEEDAEASDSLERFQTVVVILETNAACHCRDKHHEKPATEPRLEEARVVDCELRAALAKNNEQPENDVMYWHHISEERAQPVLLKVEIHVHTVFLEHPEVRDYEQAREDDRRQLQHPTKSRPHFSRLHRRFSSSTSFGFFFSVSLSPGELCCMFCSLSPRFLSLSLCVSQYRCLVVVTTTTDKILGGLERLGYTFHGVRICCCAAASGRRRRRHSGSNGHGRGRDSR